MSAYERLVAAAIAKGYSSGHAHQIARLYIHARANQGGAR